MSNVADFPTVKFINPESMASPNGYSHIIELSNFHKIIYISGQVGLDEHGKIPGDSSDFASQAHQVFINLQNALKSCNADFNNLIKITVYLTDMANQVQIFRKIRDSYINLSSPPASTTVEVSSLVLPELLLEVEAIAVI